MASSQPVNPFVELVEVPDEICPQISGWLAMTPRAARMMIERDIEREREYKIEVIASETRAKIAESRAAAAMEAAEQESFWSRYGLFIGLGLGAVSAGVVGAILGYHWTKVNK